MSVDDAFVIDRHTGAMKGLAWAAATDTIRHLRFFDRCIIGGGDTALLAAACGCFEHIERLHAMNKSQKQCYRRWAEPAHRGLQGAVSCIDVDIVLTSGTAPWTPGSHNLDTRD